MQVEFEGHYGVIHKIDVDPVTSELGIWDTEIDVPFGRYRIVHIPTGKWITETYDESRALQITQELAALGDWSQPEEVMRSSGLFLRASLVVSGYPEAMGW